ncbi:dynein assembly factor 5, axonemal-like [Anneissia japonica]|uniref:dynein assembly factor 5, axonemal-like n=1 Tax=Anneissia japonica TaxID=1529436 RepID=UPI0014259B48|nr:dynein assembly factor 5, axonemal-like [Anneissia japonica]
MAENLNMESGTQEANDILQAVARHVNCLSEGTRMVKKRALEGIRKETLCRNPPPDSLVLQKVFDGVLKPLLKSIGEQVEKCRELSILLVIDFVDRISNPEEVLPYLMPTIVQRLGNKEIVETSEELRLNLVELLTKIVDLTGKKISPYLDDFIRILERTILDPYAEVRKQSCVCTCKVARGIPEHFHMQSESLINPLLQCISHQHSKVRVQCIITIGDVLQFGSHKPMENVISHLTQRLFDHSPQVRLAVTQVVGWWLMEFVDRYSFHHKLIPILLTSQSDELPDISQKAYELWDEVGAKYEKENEEELKNKMNFVVDAVTAPGIFARPGLGCRTLILRNMSKILPGLLRDLTDWTIANRLMSVKLLHTLLINAEDNSTQYMEKLLTGMYRACADEEAEIVKRVIKSAEIVGWYVSPEVYCKLILPTLKSTQNPHTLMTFAAIIRGSKPELFEAYMKEICVTLADDEVCRIETPMYQLQLVSCADAIMSTGSKYQDRLHSASLQLFTVLLTVLALAREENIHKKAKSSLQTLADVQGLSSPTELYERHTKDLLDSLKGTYKQWNNHSLERFIFDTLLTEAGPILGALLNDVIPMLRENLRTSKDPELRLKFFSLLSRLVMNSGASIDSQQGFENFAVVVVKEMVLPNCVWHAGRVCAAIRTTAVSCLWALFQSELLTQEQAKELFDELLTQLKTLLEDEVKSTRLITCRIFRKFLLLCGKNFDPDHLHSFYIELLKRLDDSSDDIRVAVARTFSTYFQCFPDDYDTSLYGAHLEGMYKGLLVHLDDPYPQIQQELLDVLKEAGRIKPSLLLQELEAVEHKHRTTTYCDQLSNHLKTLL